VNATSVLRRPHNWDAHLNNSLLKFIQHFSKIADELF